MIRGSEYNVIYMFPQGPTHSTQSNQKTYLPQQR
jgi:hypothetical protein